MPKEQSMQEFSWELEEVLGLLSCFLIVIGEVWTIESQYLVGFSSHGDSKLLGFPKSRIWH
jgi:hypothetical protein